MPLIGQGGLLAQVTRAVLRAALEAEMADHLGYDRGESSPAGSGNEPNGSSAKTVRAEIGEVRLDVPRDRAGTFSPQIVPKHARRVDGFDEAIISLYAKELTTGEIQAHLADANHRPAHENPDSPWSSGNSCIEVSPRSAPQRFPRVL